MARNIEAVFDEKNVQISSHNFGIFGAKVLQSCAKGDRMSTALELIAFRRDWAFNEFLNSFRVFFADAFLFY